MPAGRERFTQVRTLRSATGFLAHCARVGARLPFAARVDPGGALARPVEVAGRTLANRLAVLPMEGWDATPGGAPTELVRRRWRRFGAGGAALVWGGEAVAVVPEGRANPRQLLVGAHLASLRAELGDAPGRLVGLQLTHSGRWARPDGRPRPQVAARNPLLDARVGGDVEVLTDAQLDDLVGRFVAAAVAAREAGFDFVDVKHCHGYLAHELLSARDRPGRYGGDLAGRTRFLAEVVGGIRRDAPGLLVGVRLSAFDLAPHRDGRPETADYPYAFGGDGTGTGVDLREPHAFVERCAALGVRLLCVSAGSPYYCPHVQRPAYFPPSDGYDAPHDPLVDVARLLEVTRELKVHHPGTVFVGSGFSYLQEWLPNVAQGAVEQGWVDCVGIGRMALPYPDLPADVLAGRPLDRRRLCRTFSDCTTAPRNGLVSGCYPLDDFYRRRPERARLAAAKRP
ncbi:MAG: NADH:flavin oxidoreductase [Acidimicrobiia bacterium]|nr:MAG: NADH:flavin oxidoreductase [Acidimicrobiia bacterium]